MIELFGGAQISRAFWTMNLVVLPFWAAMIFFPRQRWVEWLCHPFLAPAVLGVVYLYVVYLLVTVTGVPPLSGLEVRALRDFVNHPLVFLVVWAHYLAVDLFLGMVLYRDACRRKMWIPIELILCWILGPVGLLAYVLRLGWHRLALR